MVDRSIRFLDELEHAIPAAVETGNLKHLANNTIAARDRSNGPGALKRRHRFREGVEFSGTSPDLFQDFL